MADLSITGGNNPRIDTERWKKLTPREIIKQESLGEEIPSEVITWAQQMVAFSKIPDNVTYEMVDGDVGIDALDKLGIEDEDLAGAENAIEGSKTEEPGAVKDPARAENGELPPQGDEPVPPQPPRPGNASDSNPPEDDDFANDDFSLADSSIVTDPEEIRKRKERKGIQQ